MQNPEPTLPGAEHAELQESVYTNDTQGCYVAGIRLRDCTEKTVSISQYIDWNSTTFR